MPGVVEGVGGVGVGVVIEEPVEQCERVGVGLAGLPGLEWDRGGEAGGLAAFEPDVNLGGAFRRHLDEGDILDDVGKQSLAFAAGRIRI